MAKGKGSIYDPYKFVIISLLKDGKTGNDVVEHLNSPEMMAGKANQPAMYKWMSDRKDDPDIQSLHRHKEKRYAEPTLVKNLEIFRDITTQRRFDYVDQIKALYGSPDTPPVDSNFDPYNVEAVAYQFMSRALMILHDKQSNPLAIKLGHDIYKGALELRQNFITQPTNNEIAINVSLEGESGQSETTEQFRRFIDVVRDESSQASIANDSVVQTQLDLFAA